MFLRVVAFVVVACGCRVAAVPGINATTPYDAGLPERVITDSALWADVRAVGANVDALSVDERPDNDGAGRTDARAGDGAGADKGPNTGSCDLLAQDCPNNQACYPYPFEGSPIGETRCAFPGGGAESIPCQSQLECDGTTLCAVPDQRPDSICLSRCDPRSPVCPLGQNCVAYPNHPGVGVCL